MQDLDVQTPSDLSLLASGSQGLKGLPHELALALGHQAVDEIEPHHLSGSVAEEMLGPRVGIDHRALRVEAEERVVGDLKRLTRGGHSSLPGAGGGPRRLLRSDPGE